MAFFNWSDRYNTGISEIDRQHRQLVQMVNDLFEAMHEGKGAEVLEPILSRLIRYTRTHFQAEEKYMKQSQYPEYPVHRRKHEKMTQKVIDLQAEFREGKIANPVQISNFLKAWLMKHIMQTDLRFADYFNKNNLS